jgi:hypothetical protein
MIQQSLFGTDNFKLYRKESEQTSKDAAYKVDTSRLENLVYNVILDSGNSGIISDDVRDICWKKHGVTSYSSITARYKALKEKKLIEYTGEKRKGKSGRNQNVMRAL